MNRRSLLIGAAASLMFGIRNGVAQPARKPARIGVLSSADPDFRSAFWERFTQGLARLGWVEGRDVAFVYRYSRGDSKRFPALAAELVAEKPDLIFAGTQPAAVAVRRATNTIPIVFAYAQDPVGGGLVASLARPGGNATGLASLSTDISAKHLELLKEIQPQLRRAAVVVAATPLGQARLDVLEPAARTIGVRLDVVRFAAIDEVDRVLEHMAYSRPDGVLMYGSAVDRRKIAAYLAKLRLPAVYAFSEMVAAGGLISYGAELGDNYRRAADYVDKILKGAKPADLPVQRPVTFELVVNLKAAKEQGIRIPQSILVRADRVIE